MSIATATELKAAVAAWAKRSDLTAQMDNFIALAEARLNRLLRVRAMEATMSSTALSSGAIAHPTGFVAWKELRYDGNPSWALTPRPLEYIRAQPDMASAPRDFAVTGTQTVCWPQVGSVKGTYYQAIPSLTANSSNWLLSGSPDVYLFACLEELGLYVQHDLAPLWAQRTQALIDQIQGADNANALNGGPLQTRAQ